MMIGIDTHTDDTAELLWILAGLRLSSFGGHESIRTQNLGRLLSCPLAYTQLGNAAYSHSPTDKI